MKKALKIITILFFFSGTAFAADPVVEVDWLKNNINKSNIFVLDIRNKLDGGSYETFKEGHIPGSKHSNYLSGGWRAKVKGVGGQFPGPKPLENLIGSLGIDNNKHVIVVYGGVSSLDFGSASRVYWTFKTLGHENVSILNGGYNAWKNAGLQIETGEHNLSAASFKSKLNKSYSASFSEVQRAEKGKKTNCLIDARPAAFFAGKKKHPLAKEPGRINNAKNLQEGTLIDENNKIRSASEIKAMFGNLNAEDYKGYISYCNTGHWASTVWFALSEVAKIPDVKIYDGGMAHWTQNPKNNVVVEG